MKENELTAAVYYNEEDKYWWYTITRYEKDEKMRDYLSDVGFSNPVSATVAMVAAIVKLVLS